MKIQLIAVICLIVSAVLVPFNSYASTTSEVLTQAPEVTGSDRVYYNDPNSNDDYYGKYYTTWSKMRTAINNNAGYYIMAK